MKKTQRHCCWGAFLIVVWMFIGASKVSFAQGTIRPPSEPFFYLREGTNFSAVMNGAHAVPPNSSSWAGTGFFQLFSPPDGGATSLRVVAILPEGSAGGIIGARIENVDGTVRVSQGHPMVLSLFVGRGTTFPWEAPPRYAVAYTGLYRLDAETKAALLSGQLYLAFRAVSFDGTIVNDIIRGPIVALDHDGDGVIDYLDQCPETLAGSTINAQGCSIDQLCPCEGPWKNHGDFVSSIIATTAAFEKDGLISKSQRNQIVREAAGSDCGVK